MTPTQIQKVGLSALLVIAMTRSVANAQSYGVDKDCKGVPMEIREQIRIKANEYAAAANGIGATHKSIKAWTKEKFADVSDACTARITGEALQQLDQSAKAKAKEVNAAVNSKAWDELSNIQKRWVIYRRDMQDPEAKIWRANYHPGVMGELDAPGGNYSTITIISVVSPTDVIVTIDEFKSNGYDEYKDKHHTPAWITGIDTSTYVVGEVYSTPKHFFWLSRTKTYPRSIGTGTNAVYYFEPIPGIPQINNIIPPASAKLSDFDVPKTDSSNTGEPKTKEDP